jgi:23S rRNA pseudouridine1911/1915/1917 synthase
MMTEIRRVTAAPEQAGERLDRVLALALGGLSRTRLKHLVESGQVTLDGAAITEPSLKVKPGQTFAVALPPPVADRPAAQPRDLAIRYEDAHLLVLEKPAGLVVHPAPGNPDHTLVNALVAHCGDSLAGIGGVKRPGIVHRLDKDTSGLMVVAKTDAALASLAAAFANRSVTRAYTAAVWGVPLPAVGEFSGAIGRSPHNRQKMAVVPRGGKPALTRYRVLRRFGETASLVECRLATGRTHQIRVHMSAAGYPLIGDQTYGGGRRSDRFPGLPRQALHAHLMGFRHPATGEYLEFVSDLPSDLRELISSLESL